MTLQLGHVTDGASRTKTIDFLAGEQHFELMLELMNSQRLRTKKRMFDLTVEVFSPFYFYCLRTKSYKVFDM